MMGKDECPLWPALLVGVRYAQDSDRLCCLIVLGATRKTALVTILWLVLCSAAEIISKQKTVLTRADLAYSAL